MTRITVITQAETIYDSNLDRFMVFVIFTTSERPSGYYCWFEISDISTGPMLSMSKEKLVKLLEATSSESIENLREKIVRVRVEGSCMRAFSHPNKEEWIELYD